MSNGLGEWGGARVQRISEETARCRPAHPAMVALLPPVGPAVCSTEEGGEIKPSKIHPHRKMTIPAIGGSCAHEKPGGEGEEGKKSGQKASATLTKGPQGVGGDKNGGEREEGK